MSTEGETWERTSGNQSMYTHKIYCQILAINSDNVSRVIAEDVQVEDADAIIADHNEVAALRAALNEAKADAGRWRNHVEAEARKCRCPQDVHYSGGLVERVRLTGHDTSCPQHGAWALRSSATGAGTETPSHCLS